MRTYNLLTVRRAFYEHPVLHEGERPGRRETPHERTSKIGTATATDAFQDVLRSTFDNYLNDQLTTSERAAELRHVATKFAKLKQVRSSIVRYTMFLTFDARFSDSVFVERIWRCRSDRAGRFLSIAASNFEIAITRHQGKTFLTVRGPETKATPADCPADGEWLGIRFKLGTYMPQLLPGTLRDRRDVNLPGATGHSFWLNGSAWDYPDFENADTFVSRLVRKGLVVRDPSVDAAQHGHFEEGSLRTAQRRFLRATGITLRSVRQIERARHATNLLREGFSILDTVYEADYFDQAHLTRSLKHRIGQTPVEIMRSSAQLSFLYKTAPLP